MEAQNRSVYNTLNKTFRQRTFVIGDLVLKKSLVNKVDQKPGKMAATQEGPYKFSKITTEGAYKLESLDGRKKT